VTDAQVSEFNPEIPHSARIWNYWLGGEDNFPIDRIVGDEIARRLPSIIDLAQADRAFLRRCVQYLVGDAGLRQILDIGAGLPTANNTHQVAQAIAAQTRIAYVDNDPLVIKQGQKLITSSPEGVAEYIQADLADPQEILRQATRLLDLDQPVAITLLGVVHFIRDTAQVKGIVQQLVAAVPSGSYLVIAQGCYDINQAQAEDIQAYWNERGEPKIYYRSAAEIESFFDSLDLLEPGVVSCSRWRPDPDDPDIEVNQFCGVARKR
jgi:O-methyltransferase involved in polyketide biosynthesis